MRARFRSCSRMISIAYALPRSGAFVARVWISLPILDWERGMRPKGATPRGHGEAGIRSPQFSCLEHRSIDRRLRHVIRGCSRGSTTLDQDCAEPPEIRFVRGMAQEWCPKACHPYLLVCLVRQCHHGMRVRWPEGTGTRCLRMRTAIHHKLRVSEEEGVSLARMTAHERLANLAA
jgi:hypothetical protein